MVTDRSYTCGEWSIMYVQTWPVTRLCTWDECNKCQLYFSKKSLKSLKAITIATTKVIPKWIYREK